MPGIWEYSANLKNNTSSYKSLFSSKFSVRPDPGARLSESNTCLSTSRSGFARLTPKGPCAPHDADRFAPASVHAASTIPFKSLLEAKTLLSKPVPRLRKSGSGTAAQWAQPCPFT